MAFLSSSDKHGTGELVFMRSIPHKLEDCWPPWRAWGSLRTGCGDRAAPALLEGVTATYSEQCHVMGCGPGGACSVSRDSELSNSSLIGSS